MGDWGSEEATAFPFPFLPMGTLRGGCDLRPSTILSLLEGDGKVTSPLGAFCEVTWEVGTPRKVLGLLE